MKNYIPTKGMSERDWLRHRKDGIGGSDCSAVLGFNKYRTPIDIWIDKTNPDMIQNITNTSMEIGHLAEQSVVKPLFMKQEDKKVIEDHKIRIHPDHSVLRGNLDGIVCDYGHGPGVWEGKTILDRVLDSEKGMYPVAYYLQCQHNMMVSGYDFAWLSMWIKDRDTVVNHYIERNDKLIEEIKERELYFWDEYVLQNNCPPAMNDEDIKKIFPESKPTKVEATPQIVEDYMNLHSIRDEISDLKDQKEMLEFNIKEHMQDAELLEYNGEILCSHKTSHTFDEDSFMNDNPDVAKEFTETEEKLDTKKLRSSRKSLYDAYKTKPRSRTFRLRKPKGELANE